jgi:two-component system cell cycle response regulator
MLNGQTILLVDPEDNGAEILAGRLRMQGYVVVQASDAAEAGRLALSDPPAAVVADLWMPRISGVQLCRLLGSEPATHHVPVILRGPDGQRNRFWAERAGAAAYVLKGRMGDLARAISGAIKRAESKEALACAVPASDDDVRDRIAEYLDQALFDSVIAGEVRALGSSADFDRLFDLLSQFVSQVTGYRWLAVAVESPRRFALHASPAARAACEVEARQAFGFGPDVRATHIEDDDAFADSEGPSPIVRDVRIATETVGRIALAPRVSSHHREAELVDVIARELAGPIRIASLLEESRKLATIDALTGLMNRRAFLAALEPEIARAERHGHPLSLFLLDVDHFKKINDGFGHSTGDLVLTLVGKLLLDLARKGDIVGRWGGEEFVVALHMTNLAGATIAAERRRAALTELQIRAPQGGPVPVTASFGVVALRPGDDAHTLIDRADHEMYRAKSDGRNRVVAEEAPPNPQDGLRRTEPIYS